MLTPLPSPLSSAASSSSPPQTLFNSEGGDNCNGNGNGSGVEEAEDGFDGDGGGAAVMEDDEEAAFCTDEDGVDIEGVNECTDDEDEGADGEMEAAV